MSISDGSSDVCSSDRLSRVVLTGGGSVSVSRMKGLRGEIVRGGNGDVSVAAVDLDQFSLGVAGAGRANLPGRAGVAAIRVTSPGAVMAEGPRVWQDTRADEDPGTVAWTGGWRGRVSVAVPGVVAVGGEGEHRVAGHRMGRHRWEA